MRRLRALIFDVDGTLADTERDGHLAASNDAFTALGVPIRWGWEEYRRLLAIPGTRNRMRLALEALGTMSAAQVEEAVPELFRLKQARYLELVDRLPLRPGVERLLDEAVENGVRLAIVSTSSEPQIHALLRARLPTFAEVFRPVLGQQSGPKVGPDGRLYELCVQQLALPAAAAVAVEDAEDGYLAARRAGIPCLVVPSRYAGDSRFADAALVAESLADVNLRILEELVERQAAMP